MRKGIFFIIFLTAGLSTVQASDQILLKSRHFTPERGLTDQTKEKILAIGERAHVLLQLEYDPTSNQKNRSQSKGLSY